MLSREPRSIVLTLLSVVALAAGADGPARSDEPKGVGASPRLTASKADDANPIPASGRMFVVGRVLDPRGNPVPGATVMVHARNLMPGQTAFDFMDSQADPARRRPRGWLGPVPHRCAPDLVDTT